MRDAPIKNDGPIRRGGIAGNHRRKSHEFVSGRRESRRNSRLNRNRRFLRTAVIYMHIRRHCAACTSRIYKCHVYAYTCVYACTREGARALCATAKLHCAVWDVLVNSMNIRYKILLCCVTPRVMCSIID